MTTKSQPRSNPEKGDGKEKRTNSFSAAFDRLNLPLHGVRLPSFKIEDKYINLFSLKKDISTYDFLRAMCLRRFEKLDLSKSDKKEVYIERIKHEIL